MPLRVASTRYSLVKGERIVRSVLTTQLREDNCRGRSVIYRLPVVRLDDFANVGLKASGGIIGRV